MDQVSVKGKSKFEAVKINSKLDICDKKGHPLRLRRWPEQIAVCFLCRARVRTSDFRFAARTFLDFSNLLS